MRLFSASIGLVWTIAAYIISLVVSRFLKSRRNASKARQLNCEEPPELKSRYPLGIDLLLRYVAADRAKLFPVDATQRPIDAGGFTYKYSILGNKVIVSADPKNIQALLATQFNDFDLGPTRRANFWPLLGDGIFTQDGKKWEHSRAMMRPQFAREQVSDLDLEERHVQNMMKALDASMDSDNWVVGIDLQVLFFRLTLDSASEFLLGTSVDSQPSLIPGHKYSKNELLPSNASELAIAFDRAQMTLATRARFVDMYWLVSPKGFKEDCKVCHDFIDHFVRLALSTTPPTGEKTAGTKEKYVFLEALATQTRNPEALRTQALNILLAGRDTTASLLGWLFFCLSRDATRYKKLRDIIIREFGTYENPSGITFSRLKECRYLQYCNNEALRLYPVVPLNSRYANKDTTIPRGGGKDGQAPVFIPKGTTVEYSVHVMAQQHHREDIWGSDAEEFRPERWEGRKIGWEYLPFNGGPRVCLGQQFSLTEASYVTVRLLQRFDKMEYPRKDSIILHNLTLINCPEDPLDIKMHCA